MTKLKGYRKKDLDILKLLVKLTGTNAKNADAVLEKRMRMFGYSDKETAFFKFCTDVFCRETRSDKPFRVDSRKNWSECIRGIFCPEKRHIQKKLMYFVHGFKNIWETSVRNRR